MNDRKYNLTLNAEQAEILVRALDVYSRIGIGQFENILEVYDRDLKLDVEVRDELRGCLNEAKAVVGHPANGSHGIHSPEVRDEFRAAFDIQRVVRHRLAFDAKPEGNTASPHFDQPYAISKIPLPEIHEVTEPEK